MVKKELLKKLKTPKSKNFELTILPKKFTKFKPLLRFGKDIFNDEKLIELKFSNKIYLGKCFIDTTKRGMDWNPMHQCYVFISELDSAFSYDLLRQKKIKLVATDIELKKVVDKRINMLIKKGQYHFKEIVETHNKLKEMQNG